MQPANTLDKDAIAQLNWEQRLIAICHTAVALRDMQLDFRDFARQEHLGRHDDAIFEAYIATFKAQLQNILTIWNHCVDLPVPTETKPANGALVRHDVMGVRNIRNLMNNAAGVATVMSSARRHNPYQFNRTYFRQLHRVLDEQFDNMLKQLSRLCILR